MHFSLTSRLFYLLAILSQCHYISCIGIVMPAVALGLSGLYAGYEHLKGYAYEVCNDRTDQEGGRLDRVWIRHSDVALKKLEEKLALHLYGQPLAKSIISKALKSHLMDDKPDKALVLSLHGWTGNGKNYASQLIAKGLYKLGASSKFVHLIPAANLFPDPTNITAYKHDLKERIVSAVKQCPRQLFVIDEVDKMPPGLIDVIAPFMDYHPQVDGVDYRKSIFLMLSNAGGTDITRVAHEFWLSGKERTDIKLKDLEPLIHKGAFNEIGGLHKSDLVAKNLIDYYVPFLPLEKRHVKLCARDYIVTKYGTLKEKANDEFLEKVALEMEYFPPGSELYSKTGCKKVQKKVDLFLID